MIFIDCKGARSTSTRNKDDFITTIQVLDSTRNRLKRACRKDQTYDDKINQLLDLELNRWCNSTAGFRFESRRARYDITPKIGFLWKNEWIKEKMQREEEAPSSMTMDPWSIFLYGMKAPMRRQRWYFLPEPSGPSFSTIAVRSCWPRIDKVSIDATCRSNVL